MEGETYFGKSLGRKIVFIIAVLLCSLGILFCQMNRSYVHGEDTTKVAVTQYNGIDYASVYDVNYYRNKYEDLQKAFEPEDYNGLLKHFINYGMNEGRQASSTFDVNSYRL